MEANKHPSVSGSMLKVFEQVFYGFSLAQIWDLWALSKASATCGTENNLSSLAQWLVNNSCSID